MKRIFILSLLALVLLPLNSCTVPDIKPFSSATTQMTTALSEGFTLVQGSLDAAANLSTTSANTQLLKQAADNFRREASRTRRVLAALDRYAKSLVDVSESGEDAKKARDKIANSIAGIAAVIPVTAPYSAAIGPALTHLNALVTNIRTLNRLEDIVDQADQAIQVTTSILDERMLPELIRIDSAATGVLTVYQLNTSQQVMQPYQDFDSRRVQADNFVAALLEFEALAARYRQELAAPAPRATQVSAFHDELARQWGVLAAQDVELSRLGRLEANRFDDKKLDVLLGALDKREPVWSSRATATPYFQVRYDQAQAALNSQQAALRRQHQILVESQSLLKSWATAHAALKKAVTDARHKVSFQDLYDEAKKLKELIDKFSNPTS